MLFKYTYKLKNIKGFTLAELIVTLGVMSIVMICAAMLVGFISRGYITANELADNRDAVNNTAAMLTKELRKYSYNDITINDDGSFKILSATYKCESGNVTKDGKVIFKNIDSLKLTKDDNKKTIELEITSTNNKAPSFKHSSTIYMRS